MNADSRQWAAGSFLVQKIFFAENSKSQNNTLPLRKDQE